MVELSLLLAPLLLALLANRLGLPPLIGYLAAGFALYAAGIDALPVLEPIADLGVLLLLFAIGLKLDLRSLAKREVWASASIHLAMTLVFVTATLKMLAYLGLALFSTLDLQQSLVLAFAMGFSSTVFAIKALEERGETESLFGRTAIGVLIVQDLFAVFYLTISKGAWPSPWALALLALPLARPLLYRLLDRVSHGEMMVLFGMVMALGPGAALFEALGMKPDLGALVLGLLLAGHSRASELSKSLFLFKELFLVAFFLTIGQQGLPGWDEIIAALVLMLILPLKLAGFLVLFTRFRLRLRTALMASLALGNFSEFGLIVLTAAIATGQLDPAWMRVMALLVAFSFVLAAPLAAHPQPIYRKVRGRLARWQRDRVMENDRPISFHGARVLVFGMGRIGSGAYDELVREYGEGNVLGIDHKPDTVAFHQAAGRRIALGDATDSDFWDQLAQVPPMDLMVLAMPAHHGNEFTAEQLERIQFSGPVAAICRWPDEAEALQKLGVGTVYNLYDSAGAGLAEQALLRLKQGDRPTPMEEPG